MCYLLLGLPLLALPVFWLWPLPVAPYALALTVTLLAYAYAWQAWRLPRVNGVEARRGARGRGVDVGARGLTVFLHGQLWSGRAAGDKLTAGDRAIVVGNDGLTTDSDQAASAACGHHWFHQRRRRTTS